LRDRLVRNNIHYNTETAHLLKENEQLKICLKECGYALENALNLLQTPIVGTNTPVVPPLLTEVLSRISMVNQYFSNLETSGATSPSKTTMVDHALIDGENAVVFADAMDGSGVNQSSTSSPPPPPSAVQIIGNKEGSIYTMANDDRAAKRARMEEESAASTNTIPPISAVVFLLGDRPASKADSNVDETATSTNGSAMEALAFAASMFSTNMKNTHVV